MTRVAERTGHPVAVETGSGFYEQAQMMSARYDVEGFLKQLNAMPLEIRVAAFCHAECPGLRPMRAALFDAPLRELSSVFAPAIRERAPVEVFDCNVVMNAALAGQWARLIGNPLV